MMMGWEREGRDVQSCKTSSWKTFFRLVSSNEDVFGTGGGTRNANIFLSVLFTYEIEFFFCFFIFASTRRKKGRKGKRRKERNKKICLTLSHLLNDSFLTKALAELPWQCSNIIRWFYISVVHSCVRIHFININIKNGALELCQGLTL